MSLVRIVFIIASLLSCSYSELSIDDAIDEIFYTPTPRNPIDRLDLMLTKRIALSSRYNFLLSPLALKLALCSLATAASGDTQQEILSVLGFDLNANTTDHYKQITNNTKTYSASYFRNIGSWIILPSDIVAKIKVVRTSEEVFYTFLDKFARLTPSKAANLLNTLVRNITADTFDNIFNEYDIHEKAIMVFNTFYHRRPWRHFFLPEDTKVYKFYVSPTVLKNVPFMHTYDYFGFAKSDIFDAKILGMNLQNDEIMYLIVPNSLMGLPRVVENLSVLNDELGKVNKSYILVTLPKFKMDYTSDLSGLLKELGMKKAFQDSATFPGYNPFALIGYKITKVPQFFDFAISENGTGVTIAEGTRTKEIQTIDSDEVIANRPFIFCIHNRKTDEMVLIGRISDPTNTQAYFEAVADIN